MVLKTKKTRNVSMLKVLSGEMRYYSLYIFNLMPNKLVYCAAFPLCTLPLCKLRKFVSCLFCINASRLFEPFRQIKKKQRRNNQDSKR